jgi:ATP-binding cassette, subfamily B, bacterial
VGYSGSGKSSFINLILRLYNLVEGKITIDGQDIAKINLHSLRKNIAVVSQDILLFHDTIYENIFYGNYNATYEEVIDAAKYAGIHEFINSLPAGYNSIVGEKGINLSGGERQRIIVARSFLKNAPILFLDEATSQLDSHTEKQIQASLYKLMQNKTTIVIAHRLSTLLEMDRILVFEQGRIIQEGSHDKLIKKPGLYQRLWHSQTNNFLQY